MGKLVAYSGFSASNYLEQPYNPDLDFGTGDFCVMGWVKPTVLSGSGDWIFDLDNEIEIAVTETATFFNCGVSNAISTEPLNAGVWQHLVFLRSSGVIYVYLNGVENNSGANTNNVSHTGPLWIGNRISDTSRGFAGSLALFRISGTAPTAEQISRIYNDEKHLFTEGAQATLYGTSDAVTALAHDPVTDLLHVGTSDGRSVFQGLRRVKNTTDAVGMAISANNNLIVEE